MVDTHPKKKQKIAMDVWAEDSSHTTPVLTAGQLDRFSRQNAALGEHADLNCQCICIPYHQYPANVDIPTPYHFSS